MPATLRHNIKKVIRRPALAAVREALEIPSGQITLEEARFLGSLVRDLDGGRPIVEVGTLFGWSTRILALHKPSDVELITVDNYEWNPLALLPDDHFAVTSAILEEAKRSFQVKQVRIEKAEFYRTYAGPPPSLIFLDADHSYEATREDLIWATRFRDALICLHDYRKEWPGVIQAVDELGGPERMAGTLCLLRRGAHYP
jgi:predicted O-methyltransferase YrrM